VKNAGHFRFYRFKTAGKQKLTWLGGEQLKRQTAKSRSPVALRKTCIYSQDKVKSAATESALVFPKLIGEFPEQNGARDEDERQNQWLYRSQRRVRCVSVGGLYRS
jgi:hypothetical protein